ncbi:PGA [Symbiodinium necroappetens]|uniref:PGA protein n=1 Tax=Symbiodinium necroappetens TaxID=1628268 RepID=A0A812S0A4_9DINO|nr:PGA [Symbiodinium necroappetens]
MKEIRGSRARGDWPWQRVLRHARRLLWVLDRSIEFPDFLRHVGWLLTRLGTKSLLLPPARQSMQHHVPVVQLTSLQLHRALHNCLTALGRAQAQYFPSGGTLIGILREGELHGKQSPGRVHVLDKDLEWFVRADTPERALLLPWAIFRRQECATTEKMSRAQAKRSLSSTARWVSRRTLR